VVYSGKGHQKVSSNHRIGGTAVDAVVLVPAYNASTTIGETLDALQANAALDFIKAVIVLNDASADNTTRVAREAWKSRIPLEIWTNSTNAGERATVNSGFARLDPAVEWAFILHADDVVKPLWLSLYLEYMQGCSSDIASICSSYDLFYSTTGRICPGEDYPRRLPVVVRGERDSVQGTLNRGCWWHLSGSAIRTAAFRQIGGFKTDMPQLGDWEWLLRCLARGFSVLYLPRSTMLYRQHEHSISSNSFRQACDIREQLRIYSDYRDQGYMTAAVYRSKVRQLIYLLTRRTLVRGLRRDSIGVRHHVKLLVDLFAHHFLRQGRF
jgi:glycosyltransferase involved in cell wall biosynthesis